MQFQVSLLYLVVLYPNVVKGSVFGGTAAHMDFLYLCFISQTNAFSWHNLWNVCLWDCIVRVFLVILLSEVDRKLESVHQHHHRWWVYSIFKKFFVQFSIEIDCDSWHFLHLMCGNCSFVCLSQARFILFVGKSDGGCSLHEYERHSLSADHNSDWFIGIGD